ncbi:MAG: hypothetical protein IJP01_01365, partial [Oscillospiraceae bacterium]|nr:hypothetical protein [Oscillospiraceae bacterium]
MQKQLRQKQRICSLFVHKDETEAELFIICSNTSLPRASKVPKGTVSTEKGLFAGRRLLFGRESAFAPETGAESAAAAARAAAVCGDAARFILAARRTSRQGKDAKNSRFERSG